jgi:hypothetical protein
MALKSFCNNCEKELPMDENHIAIGDMVIVHEGEGSRHQQVHACNTTCLTHWVENQQNQPKIQIPDKKLIKL